MQQPPGLAHCSGGLAACRHCHSSIRLLATARNSHGLWSACNACTVAKTTGRRPCWCVWSSLVLVRLAAGAASRRVARGVAVLRVAVPRVAVFLGVARATAMAVMRVAVLVLGMAVLRVAVPCMAGLLPAARAAALAVFQVTLPGMAGLLVGARAAAMAVFQVAVPSMAGRLGVTPAAAVGAFRVAMPGMAVVLGATRAAAVGVVRVAVPGMAVPGMAVLLQRTAGTAGAAVGLGLALALGAGLFVQGPAPLEQPGVVGGRGGCGGGEALTGLCVRPAQGSPSSRPRPWLACHFSQLLAPAGAWACHARMNPSNPERAPSKCRPTSERWPPPAGRSRRPSPPPPRE